MFVTEFVIGCQFAFQGMTFLGRHRKLWKWAMLPAAVNIIVFAAAFALFLHFFNPLYDLATGFFYPAAPEAWYAWLWVGPLRLLAWLVGILIFLATTAMLYVTFLMLGTAIAAPFLGVLAQYVEEIATGQTLQQPATFAAVLRSIGVSILDELRKLGFFVAIQAALFLIGLIPIFAPFAVIAAALFTMLFLPLEYAGFAMDSRNLRFAQRRTLIWQHRWLMLGFGAAGSLTLLIPLLNFVCLPIFVTGGTLLLLYSETPPSQARGGKV